MEIVIRMHGTVDATVLPTTVVVYHFNFGSVLE